MSRIAGRGQLTGGACDHLRRVPKPALEFFLADTVAWKPVADLPGAFERVLARDSDGRLFTRILRWDPGVDTSPMGPAVHDYVEEVFILTGSMRDLMLGETFSAGYYACRPPGMTHGPWMTHEGCEMLEVRYQPAPP
jgi:hypothetical protein